MDEKVAAYAVGKLVTEGREDDWFELQRLARNFVRVYGDLSPDPAILDFIDDVKWAAAFLLAGDAGDFKGRKPRSSQLHRQDQGHARRARPRHGSINHDPPTFDHRSKLRR